MEYINQQICNKCINMKNKYVFECESCGLKSLTCKHNVFKCYECNKFFCGGCSKKYQNFNNNIIICNQCKLLK